MGKRVEPNEKIVQRSVGFHFRQHLFFNKHRQFTPDEWCRKAVDEQIKQIDEEFLSNE